MSVDNLSVIDFISESGSVIILTISDHLKWDRKLEHVYQLQEKINAYLGAIESGQVYRAWHSSEGKKIAIEVALKYAPDKTGLQLLQKAYEVLKNAGYGFNCYILKKDIRIDLAINDKDPNIEVQ